MRGTTITNAITNSRLTNAVIAGILPLNAPRR
jgi:hypothetical protein